MIPMKILLKKYPEKIAPILENNNGINIIKGDWCVSLIEIILLL